MWVRLHFGVVAFLLSAMTSFRLHSQVRGSRLHSSTRLGSGRTQPKRGQSSTGSAAGAQPRHDRFPADNRLQPYVAAGDFRGIILIAKGDRILVEKSYGQADSFHSIANTLETRFRIALLSDVHRGRNRTLDEARNIVATTR